MLFSMTLPKVSDPLADDLVVKPEREEQGLSTQVNAAVSTGLDGRHRLLIELLDQLDVERGPVDEVLIEKYVGLLE